MIHPMNAPEVQSAVTPTIKPVTSAPSRFLPSKVFVTLPAYNEQESLPELLERIGEAFADNMIPYEVIVVDDGSEDDTAAIVRQMSLQMPIHLIQNPHNLGLGQTLARGMKAAVEMAGERDIIVTMDADNTHPPGLIGRMVQNIREGCDVVIASRFRPGSLVRGVPFERHFLSFGARVLFSVMYPTPGVRDYTSGYRAYKTEVVRAALAKYGDDFVAERGFSCMAEVLIKLRRDGVFFGEVPLRLRYDLKGGVSKMRVMRTIRLTLALMFRQRFGRGE